MTGAVGIDIGGTEIGIAIVAADGKVRARTVLPTESERGVAHSIDRIERTIRRLCAESGNTTEDLAGIGIGCLPIRDIDYHT